jgi:uncharacterized protein with PIN domain
MAADDTLFARLLLDLMLPPKLAESLRAYGYDVTVARDLPTEVQRNDQALLAEATRQRRALVTCNYRDPRSNSCLIHQEWVAQGKGHAGIILVPQLQVSDRLRRWDVRDRLLLFLNQHT